MSQRPQKRSRESSSSSSSSDSDMESDVDSLASSFSGLASPTGPCRYPAQLAVRSLGLVFFFKSFFSILFHGRVVTTTVTKTTKSYERKRNPSSSSGSSSTGVEVVKKKKRVFSQETRTEEFLPDKKMQRMSSQFRAIGAPPTTVQVIHVPQLSAALPQPIGQSAGGGGLRMIRPSMPPARPINQAPQHRPPVYLSPVERGLRTPVNNGRMGQNSDNLPFAFRPVTNEAPQVRFEFINNISPSSRQPFNSQRSVLAPLFEASPLLNTEQQQQQQQQQELSRPMSSVENIDNNEGNEAGSDEGEEDVVEEVWSNSQSHQSTSSQSHIEEKYVQRRIDKPSKN